LFRLEDATRIGRWGHFLLLHLLDRLLFIGIIV
jgi:hypothetical protein